MLGKKKGERKFDDAIEHLRATPLSELAQRYADLRENLVKYEFQRISEMNNAYYLVETDCLQELSIGQGFARVHTGSTSSHGALLGGGPTLEPIMYGSADGGQFDEALSDLLLEQDMADSSFLDTINF